MFFLVGWGSTRMEALCDRKKKKINDLRRWKSGPAVLLSKLTVLPEIARDPANRRGENMPLFTPVYDMPAYAKYCAFGEAYDMLYIYQKFSVIGNNKHLR